ncbi:MAG: T9SS type A sorting domain-containing protein [Candidatus Kapaibacterium sp.]|nr:T9SS type A sorting domain-containing protein [Candidatus Kapabacteria bacterium]
MLQKLNILFWLSAVILIAGYRINLANVSHVKMTNHFNTKVCGSLQDKDILITIGIGDVAISDSLFAYEFLVEYDTLRFKFTGAVYQNTMAEYTKYRNVSLVEEVGFIRAYAFIDPNPFAGNRELIGFVGRLTDDCAEPVEFKIIDCDLTDDYNKEYSIDSVLSVGPVKIIDDEKIVELDIDRNNLLFDSVSVQAVNVSLNINPYDDLDELSILITNLNDLFFDIESVESVHEYVTVSDYYKISNDSMLVKLNLFGAPDGEPTLRINLSEIYKDTVNVSSIVRFQPLDFGNCNCYSDFKSSIIDVTSLKKVSDSTVDVVEIREDDLIDIFFSTGKIDIINHDNLLLNSIEMYNINGQKIFNSNYLNQTEYSLNTSNFNNGLYLLRLNYGNKFVNKSIIIYN